jgi:glycosyltransferase involved in cell wall biosynthesis
MNIALYAGMFRRNQDGATKTLYRLVEGLRDRGHQVAVWAFTHDPEPPRGILCHTLPSLPLPLYPEYRIAKMNAGTRYELRSFNPDIVHITVPDMVGMAMQSWARRQWLPILSTFHTDFPSYLKSYKLQVFEKPLWRYFRWFYNRCHQVLAPTETVQAILRQQGISQVGLLGRGIDLQAFSPRHRCEELRTSWQTHPGQAIILFVGRLVWYKGLDLFCQVYSRFKEKYGAQCPRFVLAGSGPNELELKSRMPDAVFCGHLTGLDLSRVYASADLFLFPSQTETYGNVILEALSSGVPAIVSDVGGCQEIVQKSHGGLIARSGDPEDFFISCKAVLRQPKLHQTYRHDGLCFARNQDWAAIIDRLIAQYQELMLPVKDPTREAPTPRLHAQPGHQHLT